MINEFKAVLIAGITIIIGIFMAIYISFYIQNYNEDNKASKSGYEKDWIISNYDEYSKYFIINEKGETILRIIDFNKNVIDGHYYASWNVNDDFDLCLGYYVIEKRDDGSIVVDDSYKCKLMD